MISFTVDLTERSGEPVHDGLHRGRVKSSNALRGQLDLASVRLPHDGSSVSGSVPDPRNQRTGQDRGCSTRTQADY